MKTHFGQTLFNNGFLLDTDLKSCQSNCNTLEIDILKSMIVLGLYPNIAKRVVEYMYSGEISSAPTFNEEGKVGLVDTSVNSEISSAVPGFLVYTEKQAINNSVFLLDSTLVQPYSILLFGDNIKINIMNGFNCISVGDVVQ